LVGPAAPGVVASDLVLSLVEASPSVSV